MVRIWRILPILCLAALLWETAAAQPAPLSLSKQEFTQLAEHPVWQKLGRYKPRPFGQGVASDIITPSFFLAENGATDPTSELAATFAALQAPLLPESANSHALCRFPARTYWLEQQTALALPNPVDVCPDYRAWSREGEIKGVSVLFISGYLSNPGSAFGHLLLRLHTDEDLSVDDVLDQAINYGAAESEQDSLVPYIVKGLTGRYQSRFSNLEFFHHNERYRESQLRNVWEYRLDLDAEQVGFLTAHIWEVMRTENRYYFLRQNCAFRIAELVELVVERDLVPESKVWVAPIDVFHRLADETTDTPPAISSVKRLASRETIFRDGYKSIAPADQKFVQKSIRQPTLSLTEISTQTGQQPSAQSLNVLLDYYAYAKEAELMEPAVLKARSGEALRETLYAPRRANHHSRSPNAAPCGLPPPLWHKQLYFIIMTLGLALNCVCDQLYQIFFLPRPVLFPIRNYPWLICVSLSETIRCIFGALRPVRVTALNAALKGDPATGAKAWRVRFGAENKDLSCDDCLTGFGEAAIGKAVETNKGMALYGFLTGHAAFGDDVEANFSTGPTLGLIVDRKEFGLAAEGGILFGLDDTDYSLPYGHVENPTGARSFLGSAGTCRI